MNATVGTNGGIGYAKSGRFTNADIEMIEGCLNDLNLKDVSSLTTSYCGSLRAYSRYKAGWEKSKN